MWSRSSQRIQNPGGRWIHRGGGPSSRGFGEAWEGRPANRQSQVSGTLSIMQSANSKCVNACHKKRNKAPEAKVKSAEDGLNRYHGKSHRHKG